MGDSPRTHLQIKLYVSTIGIGHGFPMVQIEANDGPLGNPALPPLQRRSEPQVIQATSGSSRDDSDDDEFEGELEITENMDPADAKRARR